MDRDRRIVLEAITANNTTADGVVNLKEVKATMDGYDNFQKLIDMDWSSYYTPEDFS